MHCPQKPRRRQLVFMQSQKIIWRKVSLFYPASCKPYAYFVNDWKINCRNVNLIINE